MARGGATGCAGPSETSASGAAAIALPGLVGAAGYARRPALVPECWLPSLCRPPSGAVMLEHLSSLPTQMDYKGQKLAEQMFQGIILFSAIVGFIYGYVAEQFGWTVYIVMAGFAFSCLNAKSIRRREVQERPQLSCDSYSKPGPALARTSG
ncbi:signal peptidase complex subunit 1 isoform X2 [Oryctolagus cuniculus]|uniref:signal peptidase complex subunit 1 isoform X2 n=1 Tax=Oryctolagus cuniculus TaxID=9986 RepID=UPI0004913624|nr:signal peptidase complex subunit 1 isoform X1 [Oryctolagus cuniculus]